MYTNYLTRIIIVFMAIVAVGYSQGISIRRNRLTLYSDPRLTCSPNMSCRLAVCVWQRIPRITDDRCTFLDSHCSCPEDKICAMTGNIVSRNKLITFQYRCRDPAEVLFRDSAANNNNNNNDNDNL